MQGKRAEATPSETDLSASETVHPPRILGLICCGRSATEEERSDPSRVVCNVQTPALALAATPAPPAPAPAPAPLHPQTASDSGPAPRAVG